MRFKKLTRNFAEATAGPNQFQMATSIQDVINQNAAAEQQKKLAEQQKVENQKAIAARAVEDKQQKVLDEARAHAKDPNYKPSFWTKFTNGINRSVNNVANFYRQNGMSLGGGLLRQAGKTALGLGAGTAALGIGAATGGVGGLVAGGAIANFLKNRTQNSKTSLRSALDNASMREARAQQLLALRKARSEGRLDEASYNALRDQMITQGKGRIGADLQQTAMQGRGFLRNILPFFKSRATKQKIAEMNKYRDALNQFNSK